MEIEKIREDVVASVYEFGQDFEYRSEDEWSERCTDCVEYGDFSVMVELDVRGGNTHHKTNDWYDPEWDTGYIEWEARDVWCEDKEGNRLDIDLGIDLRTLSGTRTY